MPIGAVDGSAVLGEIEVPGYAWEVVILVAQARYRALHVTVGHLPIYPKLSRGRGRDLEPGRDGLLHEERIAVVGVEPLLGEIHDNSLCARGIHPLRCSNLALVVEESRIFRRHVPIALHPLRVMNFTVKA